MQLRFVVHMGRNTAELQILQVHDEKKRRKRQTINNEPGSTHSVKHASLKYNVRNVYLCDSAITRFV